MKKMPTNSMAVLVVTALVLSLSRENSAQVHERPSPRPAEQQTEPMSESTVVHMPFACIDGPELIGSTGGLGGDRRWLVQRLESGELKMMHRAYPRFPIPKAFNMMVFPWRDQLTYKGDSDAPVDSHQRGFPKWRADRGRLMFFWGWGFDSAPTCGLQSGFFLIPYQDYAIEYMLGAGYDVTMKPPTEEIELVCNVRQIDNGRLRARSTLCRYRLNTPISPVASGKEHQIIDYLYDDQLAGCDFVVPSDGKGLFFTCPLPENRSMRGDLPSKMIVFDFSLRDEADVVLRRRKEQVDAPRKRHDGIRSHEVGIALHVPEMSIPELDASAAAEGVTTMEWIEKESFVVPFNVPFTAAVDGDDYYFVTNDGAIHRTEPAGNGGQRICKLVFRDSTNPIIACIHESSTNRIFAFRRESYIPVDNGHFPEDGPPRFIGCDDITHSKRLFYYDELGIPRQADAPFRLVSQAARVLHEDGMYR